MTLFLSGTQNAILNAILWLLPTLPPGDLDALSLILPPLRDPGVQTPPSLLPTKAIYPGPPSNKNSGSKLPSPGFGLHNDSGVQLPSSATHHPKYLATQLLLF